MCEHSMDVIGSRKRGVIESAGEKKHLVIRRLCCSHCGRVHHELPDILVPYKRYSSQTIEAGIGDTRNDLPCERSTIRIWQIWFALLEKYFDACLIAIKMLYHHNEITFIYSLLHPLKNRKKYPAGWLSLSA
ncbi:DUF6431 domain-containing protein [Petroclostridium sp. X23]|uniref:DUF6431 domain-containing protein n=1 Tax=Petroclostridium sp. X23 TaxID=3045146 RepID=UPI0024AE5552|nr:DUF6431 domain-containing protein [Petroclostridium sp. X23]WHH59850.1 DUF6431 domain-containing protein [Petroclostridium sp. X23]